MSKLPDQMRAAAIREYGGIDKLQACDVPVPGVGAGEVLLRLSHADVAVWDVFEREGGFAGMSEQINGVPASFPRALGSGGAGEVVAVGEGVDRPRVGETVYAASFLNPGGGFYAEYVAVKADLTATIPGTLSPQDAAVMGGDAGTALRGLGDVLAVKSGESVMVFGAGGGLGHFAVQLAKLMGAKVMAVASGADGVELAGQIGADLAVDGRTDDVVAAAKRFAPDGLDAVLLTAGGEAAQKSLAALRPGGRATFPHGVMPEPTEAGDIKPEAYNGDVDAELLARLNRLIEAGPFRVHVAESFPLDRAPDAQRRLGEHYLGKLVLQIA